MYSLCIFLRILFLAATSAACEWNYGCNVGYCLPANQNETACSCSECTCLDWCLTGVECTAFVVSAACNNCANDPCPSANFNCTNGLNMRTCACNAGRTGENCEFVVGDICASYPCLNGGTCTAISSNTAFTCTCPSAYTGQQCQVASNPCSSISCTHGTCTPIFSGTRAVCVCNENWQGPKCDQATATRTLTGTPTCYQLPTSLNSSSYSSTFDLMMTIEKCQGIMMANSAYEFFVVSGFLCYVGTDVSALTQTVNSNKCNGPCPGNPSEKCAGLNYGLEYLYPYIQQPNACNATPPLCNSAKNQGYCGGYSCVCAPGWTAGDCGTQMNPCTSLGCTNGATCVPTLDHSAAVCKCPGGYSGTTCNNKDGCYFSPCENGGVCNATDTSGGYKCTCEPAYTDVNCGTYMACYSSPCAYGTCTNGASGIYNCHCQAGFTGINCDQETIDQSYDDRRRSTIDRLTITQWTTADINECADAAAENTTICENFGTCTNTFGSYFCSCINGTYGFNCSINPDDCIIHNATYDGVVYPNYCVARDPQANCTDGYATYSCSCGPHWTGEYCLDDVDECLWSPSPCENFATCVNTPGLYYCECINGTFGFNCEINPNDCINATHPCNLTDPVANCTDGFASYTCQCGPDYTGEYCDMSIIIYNILQLLGGDAQSEGDLIALMEQLLSNPLMTIDMIPFIVGTLPEANRTALSWSADDMFLWAAYEEKALNTELDLFAWNDVVMGNCFTFNHFNNTARAYLMRQDGAQGALKAALKVNSLEYAPWIDTNAIMVFVHPNSETVFSESPRYNCMPSTEVTIETTQTRYTRLAKPYGICVSSPSQVEAYFYEGTYTTDGCIHSCYQLQVQKACGCMDSRYPVPATAKLCQLKDVNCVNAVVAKGDVSTWADCVCPLPCENAMFDSSFTQANFVLNPSKCNAYTAEQRLNDSSCDSLYGNPDYVIVSIRVPSLIISTYKETPAMSFTTVIGNVGGLGGVVCGINLITFFEFGFYFFVQLPMTLIFNREIN
ncbi:egas-3 [Pristionchus pacificus]|uniref:Egas-3 n=1 Tax=Pristionchus pacificus TaxID=54126 RepID=A0A2A6CKS2_PRIPA|nr:egas-3 [Pristionchus pacificus]|eukprot:PDM78677.1 egas-3 [Pristionchus pacificus]